MSEELVEYAVRFKDIDEYVGLYMVTDDGRVFNKKFERFLKPGLNRDGYLYVSLSKNNVQKSHKVHKLVANAFIDNVDNKPYVDHINTNKIDNNITNLRFATCSENQTNSKTHKNNKLQIKGISGHQNRYQAHIRKDGNVYQKRFKTLEEAVAWRKQKEEELHGEYAFKT